MCVAKVKKRDSKQQFQISFIFIPKQLICYFFFHFFLPSRAVNICKTNRKARVPLPPFTYNTTVRAKRSHFLKKPAEKHFAFPPVCSDK